MLVVMLDLIATVIATQNPGVQFPSLAGLHNCLSGQNLSFKFPVTNQAFIHIIHVEGNHWIAIEHISSDCVNIYDSVNSSVSTDTKLQIASCFALVIKE